MRVLDELLKHVMKKDVHYGTIPGTKKPTLYKPGAEKITASFRLVPRSIVEDLSGPDFFRYRVRVELYNRDGVILGEGVGECSTLEEKYMWRAAVCDEEFAATGEDRKRVKYAKGQGGSHYTVKQIRTNAADIANTVLKMADKRAYIAVVLKATAASDVFDQDLEDLPPEVRDGIVGETKEPVKPPQEKGAATEGQATDPTLATEPQHRKIRALLSGLGYKKDDEQHNVASSFLNAKVESFSTLTKNQASQFIDHLEKTAKDSAAG
jgi:hypothetical protein